MERGSAPLWHGGACIHGIDGSGIQRVAVPHSLGNSDQFVIAKRIELKPRLDEAPSEANRAAWLTGDKASKLFIFLEMECSLSPQRDGQ